jgi:hypothetical protein
VALKESFVLNAVRDFVRKNYQMPYRNITVYMPTALWAELFKDLNVANNCASATIGIDGWSINIASDDTMSLFKGEWSNYDGAIK